MTTLTSKSVTVEAEQWTGELTDQLKEFIGDDLVQGDPLIVSTPEGPMPVRTGYWILRWTDGTLLINSPSSRERAYTVTE